MLTNLDNKITDTDKLFTLVDELCPYFGWNEQENEEENIFSFLIFLWNFFEGEKIETEKYEMCDKKNIVNTKKKNHIFIPLTTSKLNEHLDMKQLVIEWLYDGIFQTYDKSLSQKNLANFHFKRIINKPKLLSFKIQRTNETILVDIPKTIILPNVGSKKINATWKFLSSVCKKQNPENENVYYYSLIPKSNEWFIFNYRNKKKIEKIFIDNTKITEDVKRECILIFYILE